MYGAQSKGWNQSWRRERIQHWLFLCWLGPVGLCLLQLPCNPEPLGSITKYRGKGGRQEGEQGQPTSGAHDEQNPEKARVGLPPRKIRPRHLAGPCPTRPPPRRGSCQNLGCGRLT